MTGTSVFATTARHSAWVFALFLVTLSGLQESSGHRPAGRDANRALLAQGAKDAGKAAKGKKEEPDPDTTVLTEAEMPFPEPNPVSLTERIAAETITEDFRVKPEIETGESGTDAAMDFAYVKAATLTILGGDPRNVQFKSGRLGPIGSQHWKNDGTVKSLRERVGHLATHSLSLYALHRYGVPHDHPRMLLAHDSMCRHIEELLGKWVKSGKLVDLPDGAITEFLGWSLLAIEAHERARSAALGGKEEKGSDRSARLDEKRNANLARLIKTCVRAMEADVRECNTSIGWGVTVDGDQVDSEQNRRRSTPFIRQTVIALQGLAAAARLGHLAKDASIFQRVIRVLHLHQRKIPESAPIDIKFVRHSKRESKGAPVTENSVASKPTGWAHNLSEGRITGNQPGSGQGADSPREFTRQSDMISTPDAISSLLLARHLAVASKLDPYKFVKKDEFEQDVADGLAFCILHGMPALAELKEETLWGGHESNALPALQLTMTLTGNRVLGKLDWHRLSMQRVGEARWGFLKMTEQITKIRERHVSEGRAKDSPEAEAEVATYLKDRAKFIPFPIQLYHNERILLTFHATPPAAPTPGPAITGGGKHSDGNKSSDDKPAEGKQAEGKPDDKKDGEGEKGGENKTPPAPKEQDPAPPTPPKPGGPGRRLTTLGGSLPTPAPPPLPAPPGPRYGRPTPAH